MHTHTHPLTQAYYQILAERSFRPFFQLEISKSDVLLCRDGCGKAQPDVLVKASQATNSRRMLRGHRAPSETESAWKTGEE